MGFVANILPTLQQAFPLPFEVAALQQQAPQAPAYTAPDTSQEDYGLGDVERYAGRIDRAANPGWLGVLATALGSGIGNGFMAMPDPSDRGLGAGIAAAMQAGSPINRLGQELDLRSKLIRNVHQRSDAVAARQNLAAQQMQMQQSQQMFPLQLQRAQLENEYLPLQRMATLQNLEAQQDQRNATAEYNRAKTNRINTLLDPERQAREYDAAIKKIKAGAAPEEALLDLQMRRQAIHNAVLSGELKQKDLDHYDQKLGAMLDNIRSQIQSRNAKVAIAQQREGRLSQSTADSGDDGKLSQKARQEIQMANANLKQLNGKEAVIQQGIERWSAIQAQSNGGDYTDPKNGTTFKASYIQKKLDDYQRDMEKIQADKAGNADWIARNLGNQPVGKYEVVSEDIPVPAHQAATRIAQRPRKTISTPVATAFGLNRRR